MKGVTGQVLASYVSKALSRRRSLGYNGGGCTVLRIKAHTRPSVQNTSATEAKGLGLVVLWLQQQAAYLGILSGIIDSTMKSSLATAEILWGFIKDGTTH